MSNCQKNKLRLFGDSSLYMTIKKDESCQRWRRTGKFFLREVIKAQRGVGSVALQECSVEEKWENCMLILFVSRRQY